MASRCAEGAGPRPEGVNGSTPLPYGCFRAARRLSVQQAPLQGLQSELHCTTGEKLSRPPGPVRGPSSLEESRGRGLARRAVPGCSCLRCSGGQKEPATARKPRISEPLYHGCIPGQQWGPAASRLPLRGFRPDPACGAPCSGGHSHR
ncbi:hypothetical protein NDU88_001881 [Pleurodeles waltl]|uniref:Uncharacterized protein n=1 Tax=Pleurodeles waltl TaxID=8319 RepID=A0AAV7W1B4_PLEWA|nr:hypothetical protein NDU88_001881 [Pleurodeles waltl]